MRRIPNPGDRRSLAVELTAKGRKLVDELVGEHVENERAMLAVLSRREREQLTRTMRKLMAHLA